MLLSSLLSASVRKRIKHPVEQQATEDSEQIGTVNDPFIHRLSQGASPHDRWRSLCSKASPEQEDIRLSDLSKGITQHLSFHLVY